MDKPVTPDDVMEDHAAKIQRHSSLRHERPAHILNAASNLLGICLVLITGLKISGFSRTTFADEITMCSSLGFLAACLFSYASIRARRNLELYEKVADALFIAGLLSLFSAVTIFYLDLFVQK